MSSKLQCQESLQPLDILTLSKDTISSIIKADGVPAPGSKIALIQSELIENQKDGTIETPTTITSQMVSAAAKAEGGPSKGSHAAELQSQLSKQRKGKPSDVQEEAGNNSNKHVAIKDEVGRSSGSETDELQSEHFRQQSERQLPDTSKMSSNAAKAEVAASVEDTHARKLQSESPKRKRSEISFDQTIRVESDEGGIQGRTRALEFDLPFREARRTNEDNSARSREAKIENFKHAASDMAAQMVHDPSHVTSRDAGYLESRESRALGGVRPPKFSIAAEAKRLAVVNERAAAGKHTPNMTKTSNTSNTNTNRGQSKADREAEFQKVVDDIEPKLESDPSSITKTEAEHLHSLERRAHNGVTEKGGISATVQKVVAKTMKAAQESD